MLRLYTSTENDLKQQHRQSLITRTPNKQPQPIDANHNHKYGDVALLRLYTIDIVFSRIIKIFQLVIIRKSKTINKSFNASGKGTLNYLYI